MRPLFKYGVPIAGGLAAGGYALSQGEDPGSAALSGVGGALGGTAGLMAANKLAGKYGRFLPELAEKGLNKPMGQSNRSIRERVSQGIVNSPEYMSRGQAATLYDPKTVGNIARTNLLGLPANLEAAALPGMAAGLVPGAAALAGLGGVAAGGGLEAMGVPGFQQNIPMDPEAYGSSNSAGARYKAPTMQYV
jgi:hypothetical protein